MLRHKLLSKVLPEKKYKDPEMEKPKKKPKRPKLMSAMPTVNLMVMIGGSGKLKSKKKDV